MTEQEQPKPCPICPPDAPHPVVVVRAPANYAPPHVQCKTCGLKIVSVDINKAIRLWNTRYEPEDVVALREQADCYTEIAEAVDKLHDDGRTILDCVVMGMSAVEDVAELRAVVEKLPKDAQGKPICPGDITYASTGYEYKWAMRTDDEDGWSETGQGHKCGCWLSRDVALAVGAHEREAALAAKGGG